MNYQRYASSRTTLAVLALLLTTVPGCGSDGGDDGTDSAATTGTSSAQPSGSGAMSAATTDPSAGQSASPGLETGTSSGGEAATEQETSSSVGDGSDSAAGGSDDATTSAGTAAGESSTDVTAGAGADADGAGIGAEPSPDVSEMDDGDPDADQPGGMDDAVAANGDGEMGATDGMDSSDDPANASQGDPVEDDTGDPMDTGADESAGDDASGTDEASGEAAAGDVLPSAGCGQAPPAGGRQSIDVGGMTREYILAVPENYDPETPYRLIFTWHPWGGSAQQVAGNGPNGYYGLLGASGGEVILVSPEGLDFGGNGLGWGNEGGQDMDFLRAMIERFDGELCFDHNRMFSTGFSFGGMMSNAVACAGLARAVAPMAGNASVSGCESGTQPVAYMGFHGDVDSVVDISGGEAARDTFVERNGCGAAAPSDSDWCEQAGANYQPCMCTSYEGCQEGYPVTWCQYSGNHMVAPNSGETIWNFFAQF